MQVFTDRMGIAQAESNDGRAKTMNTAPEMGCSDACEARELTSSQWSASTKAMSVSKHPEVAPPPRDWLACRLRPTVWRIAALADSGVTREELYGTNRPGMFHVEHKGE